MEWFVQSQSARRSTHVRLSLQSFSMILTQYNTPQTTMKHETGSDRCELLWTINSYYIYYLTKEWTYYTHIALTTCGWTDIWNTQCTTRTTFIISHCMPGLLSRPCEDISKKTIYSYEIQENYTTQNHKRLCKSYHELTICNIAVW
jgi:hypothetical protein